MDETLDIDPGLDKNAFTIEDWLLHKYWRREIDRQSQLRREAVARMNEVKTTSGRQVGKIPYPRY